MMRRANVSLTTKQIANMYSTNELTFDNAVQRGFVWDNKRKSLLIHSMMMGYPVPPLYGAKSETGYDVLDGKQRCNAIYEFMNNMFALEDIPEVIIMNDENEMEEVDVNTLFFSELEEQLQDAVKDYQIQMHYFEDITPDEISEMFFRLNNGKAMSAIELTRCKAQSMNVINEIGKHNLFVNALTEKALARYTNEDIVVKSYVLLHEEEPSLETKFIRPYMENVEFTDDDKDQLNQVFDRILNAHALITEKKIAKRLLTRTHMVSVVPIAWKSIKDGVSEEVFAEWVSEFYNGGKAASVDKTYNDCAGSGSAKAISVKRRLDAIKEHWEAFMLSKEVIIEETEDLYGDLSAAVQMEMDLTEGEEIDVEDSVENEDLIADDTTEEGVFADEDSSDEVIEMTA